MDKKILVVIAIIAVIIAVYGIYNYTAQPKGEVVIGHLKSDHHAALYVALAKGMFEKEGIKVKTIEFKAGPELMRAIASKQIDIGYVGTPPAVTSISKGVPVKIIAAVNEEGSGIVVKKGSGIHSISDLKGKTVAIPMKGSIQDVLLKMVLKQHNIDPKDVNIVEMDVPMMPKALQAGRIDAFIAWEPYVTMAKMKGYGDVLMYSSEIWKDHPCCVVIARDDFINNNPEIVKKFLKVHVEATNYIIAHKDEVASIISKKLGTPVDVEKEAMTHIKYTSVPSQDNIMKFVKILKQIGYIKKDLTKEDIFDLRYLPSS